MVSGRKACYMSKVCKFCLEKCKTCIAVCLNIPCLITACAVATSCCISDVPCQWERRNFDPHSSHIFHPIFLKLKTKKHIRDTNRHAKFGTDRFTGGRLGDHPNFGRTFWATLFYFFLYSSLSVPVAPRVIRRRVRAQTACFRPFGGLNNKK